MTTLQEKLISEKAELDSKRDALRQLIDGDEFGALPELESVRD